MLRGDIPGVKRVLQAVIMCETDTIQIKLSGDLCTVFFDIQVGDTVNLRLA